MRGTKWFISAAVAALAVGSGTVAQAALVPSGTAARHGTALVDDLKGDLDRYLNERGVTEHVSAVSLRTTYRDRRGTVDVAAGTTRYGGRQPVSGAALWQIGSNTKAFTSVLVLQLETEGKVSVHDRLGKWLPQYKPWRDVTIERLLNMTSGISDYANTEAFGTRISADPATTFTAEQLVSFVSRQPVGGHGFSYSNTNYLLAQMVIERVTHDSYAHQLTKRIITPLGLRDTCYAPYTCRANTVARMPAGYLKQAGLPALLDKPVPPLALTWAQGAGGLISSLADMATWDRALYEGRLLPARQQRELRSLVSVSTSAPIKETTATDPVGFGLGVAQHYTEATDAVWTYVGGTLGFRTLHMYFPGSGLIIAIGVNSSTDSDADKLPDLAQTVYQTLREHGADR
ncbi:serine hydrolase domain-containing protein [Actinoplanes sp. NPDC089786]|uniref:serine hydrolase domain-containing protein n=1 Tax=Actinoplanes sp. NPDC089786 TaxID=3155185 RepID=UPI003417B07C